MLKTLRAQLATKRADVSFEGFVLDAIERAPQRDIMLEECGAPECRHDDDDYCDEDIGKLIDALPESDIDMDNDSIIQGIIHGRDAQGDEQDMSVEECCEAYIPPTEEV